MSAQPVVASGLLLFYALTRAHVIVTKRHRDVSRVGVERGRKTRAKLKVGICGEHGGDPASVAFCHELALDYVSCSPFRVPIARLAAAQAALGKDPASQA